MTAVVAPWSRFAEDAVVIPEYTAERSMPVPYIWVSKLFVPIRRAETSDRSGGFTRLSSSKIHQTRIWHPALPGDRSGGSARLPSSKIHQARVCPRRLAVKNPPFPEKRGISITICSTLYAERKLAIGRAVLLDFRQAKSIRHEFVRGDSPHYMSKGSMPRTGWPFSDR